MQHCAASQETLTVNFELDIDKNLLCNDTLSLQICHKTPSSDYISTPG